MSDPNGFRKFKRADLTKRRPDERVGDWKEFYLPAEASHAREQAARCMDCGVAFCHGPTGCPLHNVIPQWNGWVQDGNWQKALGQLHATNNFPEFTGRLCPAPCESACVLGITDEPVTIRVIENEIAEKGFAEGWIRPEPSAEKRAGKIAVVGSGPAGLAAAQQLARRGYAVTVFERAEKPGGLLRFGIPDFKMEKWVLDRRIDQLVAEGVTFSCGVEIGANFSASRLRSSFDAVLLTIGAEAPRDLEIPGRHLGGIRMAMDYLTEQNRRGDPAVSLRGKKVIVIGGGDTGSDCIGTAHRQGSTEVLQLEILPEPPKGRDPATPWPLWPLKLKTSHAHEEGASRDWSVRTLEFIGDPGQVKALRMERLRWENGRPLEVPGSQFELPADLVLLATGFQGVPRSPWIDALGVRFSSRGNLEVDSQYRTSSPGVFSAGDAKRGASLIVWAIAEGRNMAEGVHRFLQDPARQWPRPTHRD